MITTPDPAISAATTRPAGQFTDRLPPARPRGIPVLRSPFLLLAALLLSGAPPAPAEAAPAPVPAPAAEKPAAEAAPGPWHDPADPTLWPNQTSRANGDRWLVENHDRIRQMRPRVLVINFSNEHDRPHLDRLLTGLQAAMAESSRYHGYADPQAPVFLQYEIFKFVDLRDDDRRTGDSRRVPVKDPTATDGFNMRYAAYFTEEFARHYGVPDPDRAGRFLRLDELLERGYCHEVWLCLSGAPENPRIGAYEVVELKPQYDDAFRTTAGNFVQAGNGGDPAQPWTGRSVRIGAINASRGVGCYLESLAHGLEGTSSAGAIPYLTGYFKDYAGFNLKEKYQAPFESLYAVHYGRADVQYPNPGAMVARHGVKEFRIDPYICTGGNAHFPPNGRRHYDLDNTAPVLSTIEDWRIGSGPDGRDAAKPFTNAAFSQYRALAPDCMGPWLVYWRQNMPGLDNRQKDSQGRPMKNWWPFLFY